VSGARSEDRGQQANEDSRRERQRDAGEQEAAVEGEPHDRREPPRHAVAQTLDSDGRESEAQHAGCERQNEVLDDDLGRQPARRRAVGRAHRELALPRQEPGEEEIARVRAADEEQKQRAGPEEAQRRVELADELILQRPGHEAESPVGRRIDAGRLLAQTGHVGARLRDRNAGLPTREGPEDRARAVLRTELAENLVREPERDPRLDRLPQLLLGRCVAELRRRDADDRERAVVQDELGADDLRRTAELPLPDVVREDDDRIGVHVAVLRRPQGAAELGAQAEELEVRGRDPVHVQAHRLLPARERERAVRLVARQDVEGSVPARDVGERRVGEVAAALRKAGIRAGDEHQAVGIGIRQRRERHGAHAAPDRRRRADPEAERHDHRRREARRAREQPEPEAGVAREVLHAARPSRRASAGRSHLRPIAQHVAVQTIPTGTDSHAISASPAPWPRSAVSSQAPPESLARKTAVSMKLFAL